MPLSTGDRRTNFEVFRFIENKGEKGATPEELTNHGLFNNVHTARCWLSRQKSRGYLIREAESKTSNTQRHKRGRSTGLYFINHDKDWAAGKDTIDGDNVL